jgi:zinc transport system permease protein
MLEALAFPFFQRALLAGALAGIACGVIGTWVVARRMASISGGLAHAAFGGVGLGYLAGFPPLLGAAGFGVSAALVVGLAVRRLGSSLDTVIALVWSVGMALGVVFIALAPGYAPDLTSYLFGNLLFAPPVYVGAVAVLDVALIGVVWWLYEDLRAVAFDEDFAEISGLPVERLFLLLLALIALTIVALIRVVGIILAIALLTAPAAAARHWCDTLGGMMVAASAISAAAVTGGLWLAWALSAAGVSVPAGPLVILLAALVYTGSSVASRLRR